MSNESKNAQPKVMIVGIWLTPLACGCMAGMEWAKLSHGTDGSWLAFTIWSFLGITYSFMERKP